MASEVAGADGWMMNAERMNREERFNALLSTACLIARSRKHEIFQSDMALGVFVDH